MSTSCSLLRTAFPTHPLQRSGAELAGAPEVPAAVRGGAGGCWNPIAQPGTVTTAGPALLLCHGRPRSRGKELGVPPCVLGSWGCSSAHLTAAPEPSPGWLGLAVLTTGWESNREPFAGAEGEGGGVCPAE